MFETREANRGTIVDNEVAGVLYLADGMPAANARVRMFPVDHVPDSSSHAYADTTDSEGRYVLGSVAEGEYNVLGDLDGRYSYRDSILILDGMDSVLTDTLKAPGSLSGIVALQPNHDPASVTIQVLGTHNHFNVDTAGRFRLNNLAGGRYSLRLVTTSPEYTPLYILCEVKSGVDDTLADTLRLPFTGTPVVTGLRAEYDTLQGIVRLGWNAVEYRDFAEYLIFRDSASALHVSETPIGGSVDTVFADTLFPRGPHGAREPDRNLRYWVKVRNKTHQVGLGFGFLQVTAPSPHAVKPVFRLSVASVAWNPAVQADTTELVAGISSPARRLVEVSWSLAKVDSVAARRLLDGSQSTEDTLRFAWGHEGAYTVYASVLDDAGTRWLDSLRVPGNRAPTLEGNLPDTIESYLDFRFAPLARDPDGDSLRYSAAGLPAWASLNVFDGTVSGKPGIADTGESSGITLHVTDGRRSDSLGPFTLTVRGNPWRPLAPVPKGQIYQVPAVFKAGETLYSLYGTGPYEPGFGYINAYSSRTDRWELVLAKTPDGEDIHNAVGRFVGGKAYLFGVQDNVFRQVLPYAWDTASHTSDGQPLPSMPLQRKTPSPNRRSSPAITSLNGKIYVMGGFSNATEQNTDLVEEYDPTADTWTTKTPLPSVLITISAVPFGNEIMVLGGNSAGSPPALTQMWSYDPEADSWTRKAALREKRSYPALCAAQGKIYAFGGLSDISNGRTMFGTRFVEVYDPAKDLWTRMGDFPEVVRYGDCAEMGDKVFVMVSAGTEAVYKYSVYEFDPRLGK